MAKLKPIHPGEILREGFMVPLGLNANALALASRSKLRRSSGWIFNRNLVCASRGMRRKRW
jgi:antitoxin HigA-1